MATDQGPTPSDPQCTYTFTMKHRWSVKNHLLSGITLRPWLRLLWEHGPTLDWALYFPRILFLTGLAAVNSCLAAVEAVLYGGRWEQQQLHPEPVFILGHPRTGTTHLHNLLSLDGRFAFATTFQAGFPSSFLTCERFKDLLAPLIDNTRPMDAMALTFDTPAEDEIATNVLSGGVSPYMPVVLMRSWRRFFKYFTFEKATEQELRTWTDSFLGFLRKVTYRHGGGSHPKPLLIKSPVHTARLQLLLRLFPRAKFLYIHRHPLQVFQSAAHMADAYYWYCYLQHPTDREITDFILEQYELLYEQYMRDRSLVPPGNLIELSFQQLDSDPLGTMQQVYQQFGWGPEFERVRPAMERYCASLGDFKKNDHRRLPPGIEALVRERWAASFAAFGYE